jgi:hypothetical protein
MVSCDNAEKQCRFCSSEERITWERDIAAALEGEPSDPDEQMSELEMLDCGDKP